jgi:S-adenosylmethionine synthetase
MASGDAAMDHLALSKFNTNEDSVEFFERKDMDHPDTICDTIAEALLRNLYREYRRCFGKILHHNVDEALLRGGRAAAALGGKKCDAESKHLIEFRRGRCEAVFLFALKDQKEIFG